MAGGCAHDLGVGGVSYLEELILYERWAGERLVLEKVLPYSGRAGRPISVSAVPVGPGIDIWRSCRFIGSIFRFLDRLPGGLRRFISCNIGANHCRLRRIGWETCGHRLASRPLETSDPGFLDDLLRVFGYPGGSGALLLAGQLPLRYCTDRCALRKPCWGLPERGHVHSLLTPVWEGASIVEVDGTGFYGGSYTGTRKTNSSKLRRFGDSSNLHSRRWKRLCPFGEVHDISGKRGRLSLVSHEDFPEVGVG